MLISEGRVFSKWGYERSEVDKTERSEARKNALSAAFAALRAEFV